MAQYCMKSMDETSSDQYHLQNNQQSVPDIGDDETGNVMQD